MNSKKIARVTPTIIVASLVATSGFCPTYKVGNEEYRQQVTYISCGIKSVNPEIPNVAQSPSSAIHQLHSVSITGTATSTTTNLYNLGTFTKAI